MNILYLTDGDLAPHKAPQIHVSQFLKHWHRVGHSVLLRAPRTNQTMPDFEFPHAWLPHSGIRKLGDLLFFWRLYRQLKRELKAKKWDVVCTRQISSFPALYRLCQQFGVPVLCEVNGFLLENYATGGASAWKMRMVERLEAAVLRHSNLIVVPYQALKARMMAHYSLPEEKVMVVNNGVDPDLFHPMDRQTCRAQLGLQDDAVYVGYVGSFDFYHDMETLLNSYREIAARLDVPLRFLMVGDGEHKDEVEAMARALGIAASVQFVGAVKHGEVPVYINACVVMLALQPRERQQLMGEAGFFKSREYLACEVPMILSHIKGEPYPFPQDACVYIEPESKMALIEAVVAVATGTVHCVSMRDEIIQHGSWAYSAELLEKKMRELIGHEHV